MKSGGIWLKVLAVCSTVALGGGYVWRSQEKATARREKEAAKETQVLPGSKSAVFSGERIEFSDEHAARRVESAPDTWGVGWKEGKKDPRTNSDFIDPPSEPEKERTVLPGSKSIDRILQPPDLQQKSEP